MGAEGYFSSVAGDHGTSERGFGYVADEFHAGEFFYLLMIVEGHGEEKFIILSAVESCGHEIHSEFFGHDCSLVVNGDTVLIDAAAGVALLADVEEFGAEAVADIHHGCGDYAGLVELLDNVAACFRFELTLHEIFLAVELGDEVFLSGGRHFLAFEELQSHIGCSEIA